MPEQANHLHPLKDKEEGGGPAVRTQTPKQHAPDLLARHQNRAGHQGIVLPGKCLSSSVSNTVLLLLPKGPASPLLLPGLMQQMAFFSITSAPPTALAVPTAP